MIGPGPYVVVLGIAQDGGFPQIGCRQECCREAWDDPSIQRRVTALGLVDPGSGRRWLFEASPDIRWQMHRLGSLDPGSAKDSGQEISGIFLTHAHLGHYSGLASLGREALGGREIPVHVMPRLQQFLESNGPWNQLVQLGNIVLHPLAADEPVELAPNLHVTPFSVPHRGEFSETVGFRIAGPTETVIFLPDIDRWEDWSESLIEVVRSATVSYLDGTFFDRSELPQRDRAEIRHPPVVDTMDRLEPLSPAERTRVRFLHLNHSNPLLRSGSEASQQVRRSGFGVAEEGERVFLAAGDGEPAPS